MFVEIGDYSLCAWICLVEHRETLLVVICKKFNHYQSFKVKLGRMERLRPVAQLIEFYHNVPEEIELTWPPPITSGHCLSQLYLQSFSADSGSFGDMGRTFTHQFASGCHWGSFGRRHRRFFGSCQQPRCTWHWAPPSWSPDWGTWCWRYNSEALS